MSSRLIRLLEFVVIILSLVQAKGKAKGKAKGHHSHGKLSSRNVGMSQCPTKCHWDQVLSTTVREVVTGKFAEETRMAKHCDTNCHRPNNCLRSQDPDNTKIASYICEPISSLCNLNENSACERHVIPVYEGALLPWPYERGDSNSVEKKTKPPLSDYNRDNCPVCMKPDLSKLSCIDDIYKTERCVEGDSCWLFELSGEVKVHLTDSRPRITFDNIIKCEQNELVGRQMGCTHSKCTGKFREMGEMEGTAPSEPPSTETTKAVEIATKKPPITTDSEAITTKKPPVTTDSEAITTKKPPITTDSEAITTKKPPTTKPPTTKPPTTKPPTTKPPTTKPPTTKPPTTKPRKTTLINIESTTTPAQELDNLEREEGECNAEVQNCGEPGLCFKITYSDGRAEYLCSEISPECNQDAGCDSTCYVENQYSCGNGDDPTTEQLTTTATPTTEPTPTPVNDTDDEVEPGVTEMSKITTSACLQTSFTVLTFLLPFLTSLLLSH